MSYRDVLNNLTQGEQRNADRARSYDQDMIASERQRDLQRLNALQGFSRKLDQFVQDKYKRDDAQLQKDMELKAIEEHLEAKEQTGNPNISEEVNAEYLENRDTILQNDKALAKTANSALEQGASFQEAKQIHNLSGAGLYYYVRAKSKIAADGYEDWITGEMNNNKTLELEVNNIKFTPATAETLDQKNVAMKALRREYMRQNDLGSVNPALLNDESVGFFNNVINAHNTLSKKYEQDESIKTGIDDRLEAVNQFKIDKNFESLMGKIKITANENGENYTYAEALDETFEIIKNSVLNGDITLEELQAIKDQEIIVNGKKTTVSRWRTRWRELETDLATETKRIFDAEEDVFDMQGDKYIDEIQAKEAELQKEDKRYSEDEIDEMIANWDPRWGTVDSYLTNLKTRSTEDGIDEDLVKIFKEKIKKKQPIYQTDVNRINDPELWSKWTKTAKEAANQELMKAEEELRDETVKGLIETTFFDTVENPKGTKWRAANTQAIEKYNDLYEKLRGNFETSRETHNEVMKILEKQIEKKPENFTKWEWQRDEGQSRDQVYFRNKEIAQEALKIDSDYIVRSVIPGTEEALETYIKSGGEIMPQIYEDLAVFYNKNTPDNKVISPTELAYRQSLTVDKDAKNIKTEIFAEIEELEKLQPHIRATLLRHPDQFKVARAKLLALKEDGDISYNDIEYLIDEVVQMDIEKDNKIKPIDKKLEPRIGDWKDIEGIGYVVWDGEEWLRKGNKGRYKKPYLGNVENYRDIDNFVKPYDGNYTGEIPLGAWYKLPNAIGYAVWDGKNWVRSGNKTRAAEYKGEIKELIDVDGEVKKLY